VPAVEVFHIDVAEHGEHQVERQMHLDIGAAGVLGHVNVDPPGFIVSDRHRGRQQRDDCNQG